MSALRGATCYSVGPNVFPAVDITEDDLIELLEESGFPGKNIELQSIPADRTTRDYTGIMFATATKKKNDSSKGQR